MSHQTKVVLLGAAAVVAFDVVASLASRAIGFPYEWAGVGSYLLYLGVGFVAARGAAVAPVGRAATAAGLVGLADASVGWAASWALGPGRLPAGAEMTPGQWLGTAAFVAVVAAGLGALGGLAGRRRRRPAADAPAA